MPDQDLTEKSDADFLRDLAETLYHIPVMYGTDGYHVDRLREIATKIQNKETHGSTNH